MRTAYRFGALAAIVLLSRLTFAFPCPQAGSPDGKASAPLGAPANAPGPVPGTPASPQPIAAANIATEAEAANFRLRRIRRELDNEVKVSAEEIRLKALSDALQRIRPALESGDVLRNEELANYLQDLRRFRVALEELQTVLMPRSRVLEQRREELKNMELLWGVTLQSLPQQEAHAPRELILATQKQISDTATVIRTYRPVLLTLQTRISQKRILVDDLLTQTNDAIDESRAKLFTADSEPLWRLARTAQTSESFVESARKFYLQRGVLLFEYLQERAWRVLVHLLILLLLIWLLTGVSRRNRKWLDQGGAGGETGTVLHHPVSAALVLSVLLSLQIYPNAPTVLYQAALLLMVFPLLYVVSGALSRDERAISYFLSGLFVLRRLDELLISNDLVYRIYILVLTCLALFGFIWTLRVDRHASRAGIGPWRTARMSLVPIGAGIMGASLIANIAGAVTLAALLAEACISSAYAGAAIFAGVLTIEGFLLPLFLSPVAQKSVAIREHGKQLKRQASVLVRMAAVLFWGWAILLLFGIFGPVRTWVSTALARQWSFGKMTFSAGGVLFFLVTISLSILAARVVAFVVAKDVLSRLKLPQGVPATISMLVRDAIIAFGAILALAGAGVQWSQIVLIASAIGIGVGLGLQHLVASFIAGVILILERPIRVGDSIEVANMTGVVTRIGLRSSTIQIPNGSEVICPNSNLISKELINWTLSEQIRRVDVQVRVGYGTNPETVLAVLKKAASGSPGVVAKPEPVALFKGFGESGLNFELRVFTSYADWISLSSEVGVQMEKALREAGIKIPFPQRDIRIMREPQQIPEQAKAHS